MDEELDQTPPPGTGGGQVGHLARQSALLLSSGAISYAGSFALHVLLARALGGTGFGAWVIAFALAKTLSTLGLMGADWIVLRQGSYYHGMGDLPRLRRTIHLSILLSGVMLGLMTVGLFALAPTIAQAAFEGEATASLLRLTALAVPVMGMGQIMLFGTQAFKSMREVALIKNIFQPVARLIGVSIAVVVTATQFSGFAGLVCAEAAIAIASFIALNRKVPLFGKTDDIETKGLIKFAMPVWGTKLIDITRGQLFPVLLGSLTAVTASGAFVASQRIAVAPSAIIAAMNQVYKPMGSDLYLQDRRDELATLFKTIGKWSFALGFPLFCLQVAFPKEVLSLFGEEFRDARPALVLLAIGMLFNFGTGPVATTLIMSGRANLAFIDHVVVVTLEIGLALWLIPAYGLIGAAIARMIGTAFNNSIRLWQVYKTTGVHPYRTDYWKPIAAGVIALLVARLVVIGAGLSVSVVGAIVAVVVIGACYVGLNLLFGLSQEDRETIQALTSRLRRKRDKKRPSEEMASS